MFRKSLSVGSASIFPRGVANLKFRRYCSLLDNFHRARESAIRMEKSLPIFDYSSKYEADMDYKVSKFYDDCTVSNHHLITYMKDLLDEWKRYFQAGYPIMNENEALQASLMIQTNTYLRRVSLKFSSVEKFLIYQDEKPTNMREFMRLYERWCDRNDMIPYPQATVECKLSGNYEAMKVCEYRGWE